MEKRDTRPFGFPIFSDQHRWLSLALKVLTAYISHNHMMAHSFGFSGLHSFKDYVVWVKICAPDRFPAEDWVGPENLMTLDLAFEGLRLGLKMAVEEKGERAEFARGRALVEEAYAAYRDGKVRDGFFKLEELQKLLKKVPSR